MVYSLFFRCINSVFRQWVLHWSGCLLLYLDFGNAPAVSVRCLMNVQHFSCLSVLIRSSMQTRSPAWRPVQQGTACGSTSARALCDVTPALALCSNVLLVLLAKPPAIAVLCDQWVWIVALDEAGERGSGLIVEPPSARSHGVKQKAGSDGRGGTRVQLVQRQRQKRFPHSGVWVQAARPLKRVGCRIFLRGCFAV